MTRNYKGKQDIDKYRELFHSGIHIFREYRPKLNKIIDRMNVVMDNIANDQFIARLRESLATLSDDLFWQDQDGNRYLPHPSPIGLPRPSPLSLPLPHPALKLIVTRYFDAEAGGTLASSVSDVIRNQFQYVFYMQP